MRCMLLVTLFLSAVPAAQSGDQARRAQAAEAIGPLERAVAAQPADVESRRRLAAAYAAVGRRIDAARELRNVTELAPGHAGDWYALGQAYNAIKQEALSTFDEQSEDASWRQLLAADALLARSKWVDAFVLYRASVERLPSMVSIHDSLVLIYERTGHPDWAARERAQGALSTTDCARRQALCEFRAGRYDAALSAASSQSDSESRYWRARAATELALAAFRRLDKLPDSPERRAVRATLARNEERYTDAIVELKTALTFAPGDPALLYELASVCYLARDFEQAVGTLSPLLRTRPDDPRLLELMGYSLLQMRQVEEALPILQRTVERNPSARGPRLALGRAYLQTGDFAAAIPLIEAQIADDQDGSLHVQLARAYGGLGKRDKAAELLEQSQALQRAAEQRGNAAAQRTITGPK
jgi:predicted Zn-dependent protease